MAYLPVKERRVTDPQPEYRDPPPVNPIAPVVVALFLLILGIECIFSLAEAGYVGGPTAIGWRLDVLQDYAFSARVFDWMMENNRWPPEQVVRMFTYPFLHGGFLHAAISGVMILALGKLVGDAYGTLAAIVLFFVPSALGAVTFALMTDSPVPLIGSYPAVYGYVGAYTFLLWVRLGVMGEQQIRAFTLIGFLLGIQLLFAILYGTGPDWIADVAGFIIGLVLAPVLAPGGWRRLLDKLRQR